MTPETFESHIKWMMQHGQIISADKLYQVSQHTRFMVTFDDGWKDNFRYAYPVLKEYTAPATIFLSTGNINERKLFWSEEIGILIQRSPSTKIEIADILRYEIKQILTSTNFTEKLSFDNKATNIPYLLDRLIESLKRVTAEWRSKTLANIYKKLHVPHCADGSNYLLNWDEIRYLAYNGIMFGSHTHRHTLLDYVDKDVVDYELFTSKRILENKLEKQVNMFSYPNGYFSNPCVKDSLRNHGYEYAFTLERKPLGHSDHLAIPRCMVYENIARSMSRYYLRLSIRAMMKRVNDIIGY